MNDNANSDDSVRPEERADIGLLFLANFVHQVVNPLNGIAGTLDNINDGTYPPDVISQKINASRAQLEQCITMIRNLAFISDFFFEVPGQAALREARTDVKSVLPQVVIEAAQFFQIPADKKKIHLELQDRHIQYKVLIRPELLKQVFINMFDNWLKYGLPNQTVKIIMHVNKSNELVVELVGTSIGFDNKDAEKLFDLGVRAREAKDKVAQGSGIGLYICKQIINRALSGRMTAGHNTKNDETTFRIFIPRNKWEL